MTCNTVPGMIQRRKSGDRLHHSLLYIVAWSATMLNYATLVWFVRNDAKPHYWLCYVRTDAKLRHKSHSSTMTSRNCLHPHFFYQPFHVRNDTKQRHHRSVHDDIKRLHYFCIVRYDAKLHLHWPIHNSVKIRYYACFVHNDAKLSN